MSKEKLEGKDDLKFVIPRWNQLPNIDLYLEQVLQLMEEWLSSYMILDGKKIMTKTMVNNYVKQKLINPPVNKKYDKLGVASLFVICVLKSVYSMDEICHLIELALEVNNKEISYNRFCNAIEEAVLQVFSGQAFPKRDELNDAQYLMYNVARSFACKLYVKECYFDNYK